ncbi:Zinc finger MYND domain-containing protein 10, partial [Chytridiales sp. JEL 0842]
MEAFEADQLISQLPYIQLQDIGSDKFLAYHQDLERINIQAHLNLSNQAEEFVTESVHLHDKIKVLIHNLLVIDYWKLKIFPLVLPEASKSTIKSYFVLYHEATLVNLLEVIMYKKELALSAGEMLDDLLEYCHKRVLYLASWRHPSPTQDNTESTATDLKKLLSVSESDSLTSNKKELDFSIAISSLSILRYITDLVSDLDVSTLTLLINTNETIVNLTLLMENAPWVRKRKTKNGLVFERFDNSQWTVIDRQDLEQLGKVEAQVWIALYNLLLDPECTRKHNFDEKSLEIVLRLRGLLTEPLVDQLPVLTGVQRYLEELSVIQPGSNVSNKPLILVETVSETLQKIKSSAPDLKSLAQQFKKHISSTSDIQALTQKMAEMYNLDNLENLIEDPKCAACGIPATQRCSR